MRSRITLYTTVDEVKIPIDRVLKLSVGTSSQQAQEKGLWRVDERMPVIVTDGDQVILATTAGILRQALLPRSWISDTLGDVLRGPRHCAKVPSATRLVTLGTLARSTLTTHIVVVIDSETQQPSGVITNDLVRGMLASLRVSGWPDTWQDDLSLSAVVAVDEETTLRELARRFRDLPIDDGTLVASRDSENDRWIVYAVHDLINGVLGIMRPPKLGDQVRKVFPRLELTVAQVSELADTDWSVVQSALPPSTDTWLLLAQENEPAFVLSRRATGPVVRSGSAKGAIRGGGQLAQFLAEYDVELGAGDRGRVVNTWFADERTKHVPWTHALGANKRYHLAVNIGLPDPDKAHITTEQPEIDARVVAAAVVAQEPLCLRVDSADFVMLDREKTIILRRDQDRTPDVFFRMATSVQTGVGSLRLSVYLRNNLIQSYLVYARVAPNEGPMPEDLPQPMRDGWWAECEYTLSSDLTNVRDLESRRVCVWIGAGKENVWRVGASAVGVDTGPALDVNASLIGNALAHYRELLSRACFTEPEPERSVYLYKDDHTPRDRQTFENGLLDLAELGQMLYERVFGTADGQQVVEKMREVERQEKPLVVQIARLSLDVAFPWAAIYDRPLRYNPQQNVICTRFLREDDCTAHCPHADDSNVVCPYGFWGFRYIIEQPLRPPHTFSSVATRLPVDGPPRVALVYGTRLGLAEHHRQQVGEIVQSRANPVIHNDTEALLAEMKRGPAIVYFYCHGGNTPYRQWLEVRDDDLLMSTYLDDELRSAWAKRAPLVVLNGCHTVKYDPATLLSFVHRFGALGAAGVIGTEIPIHEVLGDAFGRFLFERLLDGEPVGKIVYDFRWELLRKRNLLGLVYVPYCYASLRIEQVKRDT